MAARSAAGSGAPAIPEGGAGDGADPKLREVVWDGKAPTKNGEAANDAGASTRGGALDITHAEKVAGGGVGGAQGEKVAVKAAPSLLPPPRSGGLVLGSVGRDLGFEATLVETLGRLVCEGALIEVVDVHKEVRANVAGLHALCVCLASHRFCLGALLAETSVPAVIGGGP